MPRSLTHSPLPLPSLPTQECTEGCVYTQKGKELLDQLNSPWLLHEYGHVMQKAIPGSPEVKALVTAFNALDKTGITTKRGPFPMGGDGKVRTPYAFTNNKEYFACLTEALTTPNTTKGNTGGNRVWPRNDWQLKEDDPAGYAATKGIWKASAADITKYVGSCTKDIASMSAAGSVSPGMTGMAGLAAAMAVMLWQRW